MPTEEVDGIEQVDVVNKSLPLSTLIYNVIQEFKKLIDNNGFFVKSWRNCCAIVGKQTTASNK